MGVRLRHGEALGENGDGDEAVGGADRLEGLLQDGLLQFARERCYQGLGPAVAPQRRVNS